MLPQSNSSADPIPAVAYVRMSAEQQQYSTANQFARIKKYGERRNVQILRTYADEGRSGLLRTPEPK